MTTISTGLAILLLGERVTVLILMGTLVIVLGTVLLSLSGKQVGFRGRHLVYPFLCASCFGVVVVIRKLGLGHAGSLFGSAINATAATIAATAFVLAPETRGRWCAMDGACSILLGVVSQKTLASSWCCWPWASASSASCPCPGRPRSSCSS
jgi:uncharacterized membrane protein